MKSRVFQEVGRMAAIFPLAAGGLGSQTFNARIAGTVTDATGAPVAAARITVHHLETNTDRKAPTGAAGVYDVPLPLPGTYEEAMGNARV
jgi:hypothetical protein